MKSAILVGMTQAEALDILKTGANVFITGAAGSGKTHLLRSYIKYLKDNDVAIGITASTGIAATHLNGMTIHSWAGIGIKNHMDEGMLDSLTEQKKLKSRFDRARVLIIDEVSMLHHFRLDLVDQVLRAFKDHRPFGGLQIILCGDFFQLPPISRHGEEPSKFAYHSQAWKDLDLKICYLTEQHRQEDDTYLRALNAIRANEVESDTVELLYSRLLKTPQANATKLYTHNVDVDAENERELEKLEGEVYEYPAALTGAKPLREALMRGCLAPEVLRLKKGARVMFIKNSFDAGYANGTLGVVHECDQDSISVQKADGTIINASKESWRVDEDGSVKAELIQYPLRLAWAITIHKSQGMSLDAAEVDLTKSFEKGMGYVALSRIRSLEGLSLIGMNRHSLKVHDEALEMDDTFRKTSADHSREIRAIPAKTLQEQHEQFLKLVTGTAGPAEKPMKKADSMIETKRLCEEGMLVAEIASARGLKSDTVLEHIEKIRAKDPYFDISHLRDELPARRLEKILAAFKATGPDEQGRYFMNPVKIALGDEVDYYDIRLARLFLE